MNTKDHYPKLINFAQSPAAGTQQRRYKRQYGFPDRLTTPMDFLEAALEQRRLELGNPVYYPDCPSYNHNTEQRPAHVFDEVFEEAMSYTETPSPNNLEAFLDPRHWNPWTLLDSKPNPELLILQSKLHINRKPRLGLRTRITTRGHLLLTYYHPSPEDASETDTSDFIPFRLPYGGSFRFGDPDPDEVVKIRCFRELTRFAVGNGRSNKHYLRSAKLLTLACYSLIEWIVSSCSTTLDIRRDYALYVTLEHDEGAREGKEAGEEEGEGEIADLAIRSTADIAAEIRERKERLARREQQTWRDTLPQTHGFTAEQAADAYLRANRVTKAAHRIILEAVTSDDAQKPSYSRFAKVIKRLLEHFPELFETEELNAASG